MTATLRDTHSDHKPLPKNASDLDFLYHAGYTEEDLNGEQRNASTRSPARAVGPRHPASAPPRVRFVFRCAQSVTTPSLPRSAPSGARPRASLLSRLGSSRAHPATHVRSAAVMTAPAFHAALRGGANRPAGAYASRPRRGSTAARSPCLPLHDHTASINRDNPKGGKS